MANAQREGAELVCFGETFLQGFDALTWCFEKDQAMAISTDSSVFAEICRLSIKHGVDVLFGYIELDGDSLYSSCALISSGKLVGVVLYDMGFNDRWYILHSVSDEILLRQMIDYATKIDAGTITIKANLRDTVLCSLLENMGFEKQYSESVLEIGLSHDLSYQLSDGFYLNEPDSKIDKWQWDLVLYLGFDHEGIPEESTDEEKEAEKHLEISEYIKVFAIKNGEYTAHCGVWYDGGETAYIEPVVTVPEHRGKGLGKAVVYEAINRAKQRGAKRAIVLSDQEFYKRLGMTKSSEVATWVKNSK